MPTRNTGNLFSLPGPVAGGGEQFTTLLARPGVRIERIVSNGEASPPGHWYDQAEHEWVLVLQGRAGLLIEGESGVRRLAAGDHVELPAHCRHRVEYTSQDEPTVWLAVFWS